MQILGIAGSLRRDSFNKAILRAATPGMTGTARSQTQLRQTLTYNACRVLPPPEVLIGGVHEKVRDGELTDDETKKYVAKTLTRFAEWIGS